MANDINELLERCKAATGPDRELDAAITVAIGDGPGEGWELITHQPGVYMMDAGRWIKGGRIRTPKPYTASIDAITALIERELPGWNIQIFKKADSGWMARLRSPRFELFCTNIVDGVEMRVPNGPLALCCAFLSAMIARASTGDDANGQ